MDGWGDVAEELLHIEHPAGNGRDTPEVSRRGRPRGSGDVLQRRAYQNFLRASVLPGPLRLQSVESIASSDQGGVESADTPGGGQHVQAPDASESQSVFGSVVSAMKDLIPRFRHIGSSVQMQLHASALNFKNESAECAQNAQAVADSFLASERVVASARASAAMSKEYGCGRDFSRDLTRIAASAVEAGGLVWGHILSSVRELLQQAGWQGLLFVKKRKFDETPLRVRLQCSPQVAQVEHAGNAGKEKSVTKILQTLFSLTMLCKTPSGDYQVLRGNIPSYLQALDKSTAENLKAAQMDLEDTVPELKAVSSLFNCKVQHTITDRFAANSKCELALAAEDPTWILAHQYCRSHKIAQIQTKATSLPETETHISGVISVALALQNAGSTQALKDILNQIFEEQLVVREGAPPEFAKAHREEVYDVFLGPLPSEAPQDVRYKRAATRRIQQRLILSHFLNGELRSTEIAHWCVDGLSRQNVLRLFKKWVTPALLPGKCEIFPRSRWTGGDLSVEWAGLLASHHRILSLLMDRWVTKVTGPAARARPSNPEATGWGSVAMASLTSSSPTLPALQNAPNPDAPADPADAGAGVGGVEAQELPAVAHVLQAAVDQQAQDEFSWAKFNKTMKDKARTWAVTQPASGLALIKSVMRPTFRFLFRNLHLFSSDWDEQQELAFASQSVRSYRIVEEYRATHLDMFFNELRQLFHCRMKALQPQDLNIRVRTLMFRVVARAGACAQRLLGSCSRSYPGKLFGEVLSEDGDPNLVLQDSKCLYDALTADFIGRYNTPAALGSADATAQLRVLASELEYDISEIESRHASVRRVVLVRSCQATGLTLEDASSEFVCRSFCRRVGS